jgi:hypothetical protein
MEKSKDIMDYYAGDNIPQGLKEIKYVIKQYVVHNESGNWYEMEEDIENELKKIKTPLYYKELLNCLDDAIELIEKK